MLKVGDVVKRRDPSVSLNAIFDNNPISLPCRIREIKPCNFSSVCQVKEPCAGRIVFENRKKERCVSAYFRIKGTFGKYIAFEVDEKATRHSRMGG